MIAAPPFDHDPARPGFADRTWTSGDGLALHYRDYSGRGDRPVVLCLPGLTRNARDFANLAARIAGGWRVVCPDLRGRGDSAYARDSASYNWLQYAEDLERLLDQAGIDRFVVIGTSLGGILAMILASRMPDRIAGVLLNDIGPEIAPAGVQRIMGYVGQGRSFPTWMHAARAMEELNQQAYPDFALSQWLDFAKRAMVVGENGRIVFDYDMKIAEPLHAPQPQPAPDLWAAFKALKGRPAALVRGELSDLLAKDVFRKMGRALAEAETVVVPRVGHAPTLDEPEAVAAIARLLDQVA